MLNNTCIISPCADVHNSLVKPFVDVSLARLVESPALELPMAVVTHHAVMRTTGGQEGIRRIRDVVFEHQLVELVFTPTL